MTAPEKLTFVDAVAVGFRKWRTFDGTASRPEFWYWYLFTVLVGLVLLTADSVLWTPTAVPELPNDPLQITGTQVRAILDGSLHDTVWSLGTLASVLLFVPTLAVTVRRFRDAGRSTVLPWIIHLTNPVTTGAVLAMGYAIADIIDAGTPDSALGTLLILALSMFGLAAANLTMFILLVVFASRPTRSL